GDGENGWWNIVKIHLYNRQWDEVIDHFVGCLAQIGRRGLNILIERILATARIGDLASIARVVGVLGRILPILDVYDYEPPQRLGWENIQRQVMDIFTPEGALRVPVDQRISAAEALGGSGDPRFNSMYPEMLTIPGMKDVLLGKYPVTVQEYQRFIENGGYEEQLYWGEGWKIKTQENWKEPFRWDDQKEHLNRPVTGVSWYEAGAYCSWLTKKTGIPFRLPTDEEWGRAAAPSEGKGDYPWGDDKPNEELLNFNNNVGQPTPVGIYPAGAGPEGHMDMAGNVWEWIQDLFDEGVAGRVFRGGCWVNDAQGCRSAFRDGIHPGDRSGGLGFRLSRSV
ncbi:MAG: formylglycine-generating enzyme family protein, partial [bacterium]